MKTIGNIGNYYGSLSVKEVNGQFYWGIANGDDTSWEEISKELYDALLKFEKDCEK